MLVEFKDVSYNTNNISPKNVYKCSNTFVSLYIPNIICEKDKKNIAKLIKQLGVNISQLFLCGLYIFDK